MITPFPLSWPAGWQRDKYPSSSRFDTSFTNARDGLVVELDRLGAKNPIISTNLELKLDGYPRAGQREPSDTGVALYFELDGQNICIPCDRWNKVGDNIHAIAKTIGAMRGIDRWGTGKMMKAMFTGFVAIADKTNWRDILGINSTSLPEVEAAYRVKARTAHPDSGGSHEAMAELNRAITAARAELKQ